MVKKYSTNYILLWTLFIVQFIIVSAFIVFIWRNENIVFILVLTIVLLFMEYLAVLVVTSPRITKSISITSSSIIIELKKESVEVPIKSLELVEYQRSWPLPRRVDVFTKMKKYVLLPWYIRNFGIMCIDLCQVLENAHLESVVGKLFRKKFGKRK